MLIVKVRSTVKFEMRICPGGGQRTIVLLVGSQALLAHSSDKMECGSEDIRINRSGGFRQEPWNFDFLHQCHTEEILGGWSDRAPLELVTECYIAKMTSLNTHWQSGEGLQIIPLRKKYSSVGQLQNTFVTTPDSCRNTTGSHIIEDSMLPTKFYISILYYAYSDFQTSTIHLENEQKLKFSNDIKLISKHTVLQIRNSIFLPKVR